MLSTIARPAYRTAYRAQQASFRFPLAVAHGLLRVAARGGRMPDAASLRTLERRYQELLARDLRNAEQGLYPPSLLFQMPLLDYARTLPRFLLDIPRSYLRYARGRYRDLPGSAEPKRYPAYFRRTFHWQTDGYLSRRSAELYDVSVEFLFVGCADVMRRQVIPPLVRHARARRRQRLRILDVGCGTGRTLAQLAAALPGQQYFGVDLSPYYLELAREQLSGVPEVTLVAENAERLPFRDDYFDAVTSVFLFHELPRRTRRAVLGEMRRVLRPGGLLVVEDSAQLAEADDLSVFLEGFPVQMHEPFYRDYIRDALEPALAEAGFEAAETERAWLSKVVSGRKPVAARRAAPARGRRTRATARAGTGAREGGQGRLA